MAHPLKNIPPVERTCLHCGKDYQWGPRYTKRIVAGSVIDLCNNCTFIIDAARQKLEHEHLNPWLDAFIRKYFKPKHHSNHSSDSDTPETDEQSDSS